MPSDETLQLAEMSLRAAATDPKTGKKQDVLYGEFGSASCGGIDSVSESFAAGIFILDSLFELAKKGLKSVCISGNPSSQCKLHLT